MGNLVKYVDRFGTECTKWDGLEKKFGSKDLLSMWVADMDFRSPECVQDALKKYMECGAYGYDMMSSRFNRAFAQWEKERHGYEVKQEWLRFAPGVVQAFFWCVFSMTEEGDHVLVLPPVYYPFFNAVNETERVLVESNLLWDGKTYTMDYADIEAKIVENDVKMLLFCSPHNPIARVWKREELEKLAEICVKHHVIIVSDEIHQDFVHEGHEHIPFGLVCQERTIVLGAPSKSFNLAGLTTALAVIPDEELRGKWDTLSRHIHVSESNTFGYIAGEAAYLHGGPWMDELVGIIYDNFTLLRDRLLEKLPKLTIVPLEGTYLMWADFGAYLQKEEMKEFFEKKCKIAPDYGEEFRGGCETWIRFNLATSRENIETAAGRIIAAMKEYKGV